MDNMAEKARNNILERTLLYISMIKYFIVTFIILCKNWQKVKISKQV